MIWDWAFAYSILPNLFAGLWVTVKAVAVGMTLALLLGLVWALGRRARRRWIAWPCAGVVEFVRSTPLLVQLYFFYFVLPETGLVMSAFLTGSLTLGLHYSCYMSEVYRAGINGIPKGQWEAAQALSLSRYQVYRHIILPQAIPPVIPALGNYLIAMFKDTPLLLVITVVEVLRQAYLIGKETFRYIEPITLVGLIYLVLSLLSGVFIAYLERRFQLERV